MFRLLSFFLFRASCWAKTRKAHLEKEPCCAACGRSKDLEVHHVVPVSVDKSKECDPTNLLTLCADPCHFVFGHLMNYQRHNQQVREDCARYLERMRGQ